MNLLRFYLSYVLVSRPQGLRDLSSPTTDPWSQSLWIHLTVLSPMMWLQPHLTRVWTVGLSPSSRTVPVHPLSPLISSGSKSSQGHPPARSLLWPSQTVPPTMGFHSTWADPLALNLPTARQLLEVAHDGGWKVNPGPQLPGCEP